LPIEQIRRNRLIVITYRRELEPTSRWPRSHDSRMRPGGMPNFGSRHSNTALLHPRVQRSWLKIKNSKYSQATGRRKLFECRVDLVRRSRPHRYSGPTLSPLRRE
jgi:hypothetical protein